MALVVAGCYGLTVVIQGRYGFAYAGGHLYFALLTSLSLFPGGASIGPRQIERGCTGRCYFVATIVVKLVGAVGLVFGALVPRYFMA